MSDALHWVPVCPQAEVTGPPWSCHEVAGVRVRLLRDGDGRIHAVQPECPHLQAPLDRAEVEGGTVLCSRHWYQYELATGENVSPGRRAHGLAVHPVRVVDGTVEVGVEPRG